MENAPTIEQQVAFLSDQLEAAKVRFARWLVACCAFSIAVSFLAVFTKSVVFFVVAGFGWFFVWNRWKCWAFVRALSSKPLLPNDEDRKQWVNTVTQAVLNPPSWWKHSENTSGAVLIVVFAVVTFFVVRSSGLLMRRLYGVAWGILVLYIAFRIKYARKNRTSAPPQNSSP